MILNCDLGESDDMLTSGAQEALMPLIDWANVACGGHAGDERSMKATVESALRHGVQIGAHPSYPDLKNFGRQPVDLPISVLETVIGLQLKTLDGITRRLGGDVKHVKPHGALYNVAAKEPTVAAAVARAVARWKPGIAMVGLAGSPCLEVYQQAGLRPVREGFADRAYEPDGTLRDRRLPGAVLSDPAAAYLQAMQWSTRIDTVCIHSDSPNALAMLRALQSLR